MQFLLDFRHGRCLRQRFCLYPQFQIIQSRGGVSLSIFSLFFPLKKPRYFFSFYCLFLFFFCVDRYIAFCRLRRCERNKAGKAPRQAITSQSHSPITKHRGLIHFKTTLLNPIGSRDEITSSHFECLPLWTGGIQNLCNLDE